MTLIEVEGPVVLDFPSGHTLSVVIKVQFLIYVDSNYGADADGGRGTERYEVELQSLRMFDSRGNDLTQKLLDRHPGVYRNTFEYVSETWPDRAIEASRDMGGAL